MTWRTTAQEVSQRDANGKRSVSAADSQPGDLRRAAFTLVEALERVAEGSHQLEIRRDGDGSDRRTVLIDGAPIIALPPRERLSEFLEALDEAAMGRSCAEVLPLILDIS